MGEDANFRKRAARVEEVDGKNSQLNRSSGWLSNFGPGSKGFFDVRPD